MNKLCTLIKKDIIYLIRSKKFILLLIVFVLFGMISPLTAKYTPELLSSLGSEYSVIIDAMPEPTATDGYAQLVKNLSQIGIFILIILLSPIIVSEKEKGLLLKLKLHNVKPQIVLIAYLISQVILISIIYFISAIVFITYTNMLFIAQPTNSILSLVFIWMYIVYYTMVINLMSYYSRTKTQAMIFSFCFYFLMTIIGIVKQLVYVTPNNLLTLSSTFLTNSADGSAKTIILNIIVLFILVMIALSKKMFVNNTK